MDLPVFVALDRGHTVDSDGSRLPTVAIDASSVPAVADLARVHAVEGVGDVRCEAIRTEELLVLGVAMTVPVSVTFAIAFELANARAFLDEVAHAGVLAIAHTDPHRAEHERPQWLAVDIDGAALRRCLSEA